MDQMKIGAYLKELRKEKNLTQEQIAEKFGVSQRSVSRWENGYTMPDISILIELTIRTKKKRNLWALCIR